MPDFRNYPVTSTIVGSVILVAISFLVTVLVMTAAGLPMIPVAAGLAIGVPAVSAPLCMYPLLLMLKHQRAMAGELERLARTDALTGLPNRRAFFSEAEKMFQGAPRSEHPLAAMMIDIDDFKDINDTCGHDGGDAVLRNASIVVRREVEAAAVNRWVVARLGGDELAVLVEGLAPSAVARLADRICQQVRQYPGGGTGRSFVTVSVGVALRSGPMIGVDRLLKSADDAAYAAKRAGRDRWAFAATKDNATGNDDGSRRKLVRTKADAFFAEKPRVAG